MPSCPLRHLNSGVFSFQVCSVSVASVSPHCVVLLDGFNFNDPRPKTNTEELWEQHEIASALILKAVSSGSPEARPEPTQSPEDSLFWAPRHLLKPKWVTYGLTAGDKK